MEDSEAKGGYRRNRNADVGRADATTPVPSAILIKLNDETGIAAGGVVRLIYCDRRSPKDDARSHCRHRIPPFGRRFGSEDPQR